VHCVPVIAPFSAQKQLITVRHEVAKQTSRKMGNRRFIPMEAALLHWLGPYRKEKVLKNNQMYIKRGSKESRRPKAARKRATEGEMRLIISPFGNRLPNGARAALSTFESKSNLATAHGFEPEYYRERRFNPQSTHNEPLTF
jgi:hypothetical protein